VVNGAIFCFNLGGILNYLLIQPYIIDGEWGYLLFQPWWYIELFVDSTIKNWW
jgi:hypothetical protein